MRSARRLLAEKPSDFFFDRRDNICQVREIAGSQFAKAGLNAVHTLRRLRGSEMTSMHLRQNMYMVTAYLSDHPEAQDVWKDGRHAMRPAMRAGAISLFDMRFHWEGDNMAPFEALNFFIPDIAFEATASEFSGRFSGFQYDVEREYPDEVVTQLARSLLPALERPQEVPALFADHVFAALRVHLLQAYSGLDRTPPENGPKLSEAQVARVQEMLLNDRGADWSVAELAEVCGLSSGHFARAFKRTMGIAPHQWLLKQRVAHVRALLQSALPLCDVALASGFADQSHMSRVFTRHIGITPGEWRRQNGCPNVDAGDDR